MEYTNRRGDRYYVFQGKTKTGKPKYFASKHETSAKGERVESLPDGFEIWENPSNAIVTVRRCQASRVLPLERALVERLALELSACSCIQAVVEGDRIVVYTPDRDPEDEAKELSGFFGLAASFIAERVKSRTNYSADLRFTLQDADLRTYSAERYCYRGSIDRWIHLAGPAPLERHAKKLLPHLGRESFFDLI